MSQRTDRVDELLRQEIGEILARDVQDPRIGFATITDVETSPDLRHARVWVSVIGPEKERAETVAALERAMGYVRHELGRRLRIRRIPELHVRLDDSAERGTRLLRLFTDLEEGRVPGDQPMGETLPTPVARISRAGDADEPVDDEADGREDEADGVGTAGPADAAAAEQAGRAGHADRSRGPSGTHASDRASAPPSRAGRGQARRRTAGHGASHGQRSSSRRGRER
jgi:ribosome-binding factor A